MHLGYHEVYSVKCAGEIHQRNKGGNCGLEKENKGKINEGMKLTT